ncbi:MAG: hypothetical protein FWC93_06590 [Defluviitaleaceae bacterium]|nr:hypothetical protein [Defluviitaleaceae bacterium]
MHIQKFYLPPHNGGKKLQTIIPISPKTNIVADNAYEFEILRLLHLFGPDDEVAYMDWIQKQTILTADAVIAVFKSIIG